MLLLSLIPWLAAAAAIAWVAGEKGRSTTGWLFMSLFLSPLVIFLLVAVPDADERLDEKRDTRYRIRCAACKELIRRDALICRYCECRTEVPAPAIAE